MPGLGGKAKGLIQLPCLNFRRLVDAGALGLIIINGMACVAVGDFYTEFKAH